MITISGEIEGDKELSRRLMIAADSLEDFSEPLESIGGELKKSFDENFSMRGGLFGGWQPRKDNNTWPLLEKTGDMRNSFTDEVHSDFVILTNTAPYFPYHQSNKPRQRLPRRVMMKIDQQRKTFITKAFQEYIVKVTRI